MHRKLNDYGLNSSEQNEIGSLAKKIKSSNINCNQSKLNHNNESILLNTKQSTDTLPMDVDKLIQNDILKLTMLSKLPAQVY